MIRDATDQLFEGCFAALTGSGDTLVELRCINVEAAGDVSGLIVAEAEALADALSSVGL